MKSVYFKRGRWKWFLMIVAVGIGWGSLYYTQTFILEMERQERSHIKLWAMAYREISNSLGEGNINLALEVIRSNENIPAILTDATRMPTDFTILDSSLIISKSTGMIDTSMALKVMARMSAEHDPIPISYGDKVSNYIYYSDSTLLKAIRYFPYFQMGIIAIFLMVAYYAFMSSRKYEQDYLWVGMAKETAHQLGTPISSLMAWLEMLRMDADESKEETLNEIQKDIERLELITERFSKIGSVPKLDPIDVRDVLNSGLSYLRLRVSRQVEFTILMPEESIMARINPPLFNWVVENLIKNAVDAMEGKGHITITLKETPRKVILDIADTGKGIPSNKWKTIFDPGITSKKRGWGLGLSLAKRIIENYHSGKIYVKESEIGKGSTFRITMPTAAEELKLGENWIEPLGDQ